MFGRVLKTYYDLSSTRPHISESHSEYKGVPEYLSRYGTR